MNTLTHLSDSELLLRIQSLLGSERQLLASLIRYIAEVEDRRLHLRAGYSSMFDFCTQKLRLSEGETFRRLTAARLSRCFPVILELVESGAIHLSALVLLRDHLNEDNHAELVRLASGKNKREVEALLVARFPKPDVPSTVRKMPERKPSHPPTESPALAPAGPAEVTHAAAFELRPPIAKNPDAGRVEPLSPARYKVQFTADQRLKDKLQRVTELMSHANPTGDLAVIVERAVDLLLAEVEKKRLGRAERPQRSGSSTPGAVTRAARRAVFARDGESCSFVSADGRRCGARAFLQLDHVEPRALGGTGESTNLRVLCASHNRLLAEQTFGKECVEARIHFRQRKRADEGSTRTRDETENDDAYAKLLSALTGLGFRPKLTRATLDLMRSGNSSVAWTAPIDVLLREATQLLTK